MFKYYFKNGYEGGTPIPKVMWWYMIETKDKSCLNAQKANELYNNDLRAFFERHPEELYNKVDVDFIHQTFKTNITEQDVKFFRKEIKINGSKDNL